MKLNDIATKGDLAFWKYAEEHKVRRGVHDKAMQAGITASNGLPPHRKPNAFKTAYNSIIRIALDEAGWSWSDYLLAKKEDKPVKRKVKKPPTMNTTPVARKVVNQESFYDSVGELKL